MITHSIIVDPTITWTRGGFTTITALTPYSITYQHIREELANHDHSKPPTGVKPECAHTWRAYQGLMESYDFCEKCDTKRR